MLIYRGAEAELYKGKFFGIDCVRKVRKEKKYKEAQLDRKLRGERLRNEARMLSRAREVVSTPRVLAVSGDTLVIEYVDGDKVKDLFLSGDTKAASRIGKAIRRMHDSGIVHNDLTTSNLILKAGKVFFIDFGLAQQSTALEDRAVDLVVFKRMLSSTHYDVFGRVWPRVLAGYGAGDRILAKVQEIESRAKYK
ncbi:MAG: Kae1-associated serine/threonine protein kinase [Candidatus Diapherotrites archaeon]|nr:Kae1-associated serine/threonine protein kinase [Candidatus Diapherotrites archaeon]